MSQQDQEKPKVLVGHIDCDESDLPDGMLLHDARSPDAPDRVDRMPRVIDDSVEIQRTKKVFDRNISALYDQAISQILQGGWIYLEHTYALNERQNTAVADLRRLGGDESLLPAARAKAAKKLIALDDPEGERFLFDMLESPTANLRLAALESLREWDVKADFKNVDFCRRILELLEDADPRIVKAAAKLCSYRSIPGAEDKMVTLLERSQSQNPSAIAEELAKIATTRRSVDALLPHVLNDDSDEFLQWTGYTFRKLVEHPDPDLSGPIKTALYQYTLRFPNQRYDQILVDHLAKCAGEDSIPVLEDIWKNAEDTVSRTYAVEALARLLPEKAIDLLTSHIQRDGARSDIVSLLREHVTESDFDQIVPVVLKALRKSGRPFEREVVRLYLIELGRRGEDFVRQHWEEFDEDARMWASWKLEGLDLLTALTELRAAGVIESSPDEITAKMQEGADTNDRHAVDLSDPDSFIGALATEGIVVMFDAETGTVPCDHDRLILQFAECSRGQFSPQWPVQFWHQKSDDDFDGPYTVQFVYQDRLFRTGVENYGDWYDVEAVLKLINFALETAAQPQRFITLDSNGQVALFVFAEPAAFLPIAKRYGLPLSDDASKAMRAGIAYEQQVCGN